MRTVMMILKKVWSFVKKVLVWLLLLPIRFYQVCISPLTPPSCRFTPTCSEYARQALVKHGPFKGLYLAIRRILRCHPWGACVGAVIGTAIGLSIHFRNQRQYKEIIEQIDDVTE